MNKPRVIKDKHSEGWYVKWYGITVWFYGPYNEVLTDEYSRPFVGVDKTKNETDVEISCYVEGEEE
jgi:hypothetical protein